MEALLSPADIVGYGGAAGGGKTDLLLGAAITQHRRAIIFRREGTQLQGIEERANQLLADHGRYSGHRKIWRLPKQQIIRFGAVKDPDDWQKYQGQPHDFIGFDETPHFLESQVRMLMAWNRSTHPGQRCRVIMGFNPPTNADGLWIIQFFAPWLDKQHPNPAKPGELRWYISVDGKDVQVSGPDPVDQNGLWVQPRSRTFIPARVEDNPYLMANGYTQTLDALPEPLRSMMRRGDFAASQDDHTFQVIPTAWVKAAQSRWQPKQAKGAMDSMGVDVSRGGRDETVIARRHGAWFDELQTMPGAVAQDGPTVAAHIMSLRRDGAPIHIDVVGWGASPFDFLRSNDIQAIAVNGATKSHGIAKEGGLAFVNRRAELWWRMRESLNPANPNPIALPPDRQLLADLCAPRWELRSGGILIESKDDIIARLGRSPDRGDAICMANLETARVAFNSRPAFAMNTFDPLGR